MSLIGLSFCRPLFIIAAYSMIGLGSMTLHHLCTGVRDPCHHMSYFIRIIYYNANSVTCSDIARPKLIDTFYIDLFQYWYMLLYQITFFHIYLSFENIWYSATILPDECTRYTSRDLTSNEISYDALPISSIARWEYTKLMRQLKL